MIDDMAVYIANLGKYNEGYLVGAWFTFPIDEEDVKEKIGLNEQYEEYTYVVSLSLVAIFFCLQAGKHGLFLNIFLFGKHPSPILILRIR